LNGSFVDVEASSTSSSGYMIEYKYMIVNTTRTVAANNRRFTKAPIDDKLLNIPDNDLTKVYHIESTNDNLHDTLKYTLTFTR